MFLIHNNQHRQHASCSYVKHLFKPFLYFVSVSNAFYIFVLLISQMFYRSVSLKLRQIKISWLIYLLHNWFQMLYLTLTSQTAKTNKWKWLTNSSNSPVVDKLPSTESKVLESEILQLSFPRLKAIVGKENNGSIIPETSRGGIIGAHKKQFKLCCFH